MVDRMLGELETADAGVTSWLTRVTKNSSAACRKHAKPGVTDADPVEKILVGLFHGL